MELTFHTSVTSSFFWCTFCLFVIPKHNNVMQPGNSHFSFRFAGNYVLTIPTTCTYVMCTQNSLARNTTSRVAFEGRISDIHLIHSHSPVMCQYIALVLWLCQNHWHYCTGVIFIISLLLKVCFITWLLCDWHTACPKVDPGGIGKKNQGDSCGEDQFALPPLSVHVCVCVWTWITRSNVCHIYIWTSDPVSDLMPTPPGLRMCWGV